MTAQSRSVRSPNSSSGLPEGYKADPKQGAMLRYQASLPHLPVPPLASTLVPRDYSPASDPLRVHARRIHGARVWRIGAGGGAAKAARGARCRACDGQLARRLVERDGVHGLPRSGGGQRELLLRARRRPGHPRCAEARRNATQGYASLPDARRDVREPVLLVPPSWCSLPCYRRFSAQLAPEKVRGAPLCMDSYKWL